MTEKTYDLTTFGEAVDGMLEARKLGMTASCFSLGGDTAKCYEPVTHHVWVQGTDEQIDAFEKEENE